MRKLKREEVRLQAVGGRQATFSPTFKFVTDMAEECIHSTMAGGPSDRRFSSWYTSGVKDWLAGRYRRMSH